MVEFAQWLQATPFSVGLQELTWLIALLQAVHILMIGVVLVSLLMICLRVLDRVHRDESVDVVWTRFSSWMWTGLAVMAVTGLFLVISEPVRQVTATSFWLKMALLVVAVAGVLWLRRRLPASAPDARAPRATRLVAVAVIVVLVAIIFLGRAIAYDVEVWGTWT